MKALVPLVDAPMAEHLVNGRHEVMVLLPPLPSRPTAARRVGEAGAFGLGFKTGAAKYFRLPQSSLDLAAEQARILVVEMGDDGPIRDGWVGFVG